MPPPLKIGIAVFTCFDPREISPIAPHWAIVAHPTTFSEGGIQVFQCAQRLENKAWILHHFASCNLLRTSPTLIGVIEVGAVQMSFVELDQFVKAFPAIKGGDDPSDRPVWSSASWVIRVLHYLVVRGHLRLPVETDKIYDTVELRIRSLKEAQKSWRTGTEFRGMRDRLQWIPFYY